MVSLLCLIRWQTINTLSTQYYLFIMGGTWFDFEILFAPNSVDFQAGTQDGLGERDWLLGNDVRPFSLKH